MKTAREIIAEQTCLEVNDVSFSELPETATYLERKTHVARPFLDKGEARSSADAILSALAAEGFSIVETGRDPVTAGIERFVPIRIDRDDGWYLEMAPTQTGAWVRYDDHLAALSRSTREGKT